MLRLLFLLFFLRTSSVVRSDVAEPRGRGSGVVITRQVAQCVSPCVQGDAGGEVVDPFTPDPKR